MERVTGIEPALSAWEADVLPLNYTRASALRTAEWILPGLGASWSRGYHRRVLERSSYGVGPGIWAWAVDREVGAGGVVGAVGR